MEIWKLLEVKAIYKYIKKGKVFNKIINLLIWGTQIDNVIKYYRKNDYIIVQGFLRRFSEPNLKNFKLKDVRTEISVLNIYLLFPFIEIS